jgi:hypothetical protein
MKNLFQPVRVEEIKERIGHLTPNNKPLWGKMNVAQMLAHCAKSFDQVLAAKDFQRLFVGRLLGSIIKPFVFRDDKPMKKNSHTIPGLAMYGERKDFITERDRLYYMIDQFVSTDPAKISDHVHAFFGKLTASEWAILMYKHLDHHLRQFGV